MASWRSSFALDLVDDHDLIERLVHLQEENQASTTIRTALREHFALQVTLADVMQELTELKQLMLSRSVVQMDSVPAITAVDGDTAALEANLNKTLGRFRRDDA
jgi:cell shape-determining protein MreC